MHIAASTSSQTTHPQHTLPHTAARNRQRWENLPSGDADVSRLPPDSTPQRVIPRTFVYINSTESTIHELLATFLVWVECGTRTLQWLPAKCQKMSSSASSHRFWAAPRPTQRTAPSYLCSWTGSISTS